MIHPRLNRIKKAIGYSIDGIVQTFKGERAFQEEVVLAVILTPLAALLSQRPTDFLILTAPIVMLLVVELINSAIEACVDLATDEIHPLAKKAKDAGSAAVLLCILWLILCWAAFILDHYPL